MGFGALAISMTLTFFLQRKASILKKIEFVELGFKNYCPKTFKSFWFLLFQNEIKCFKYSNAHHLTASVQYFFLY